MYKITSLRIKNENKGKIGSGYKNYRNGKRKSEVSSQTTQNEIR